MDKDSAVGAGAKHWTVERWLLVLTFILSGIAFTFGLGVNWAHITEQDARQKAFEQAYLRVDLYDRDQRRLSESLDRLTRQLEQMQQTALDAAAVTADRNRTTPRQRFDR